MAQYQVVISSDVSRCMFLRLLRLLPRRLSRNQTPVTYQESESYHGAKSAEESTVKLKEKHQLYQQIIELPKKLDDNHCLGLEIIHIRDHWPFNENKQQWTTLGRSAMDISFYHFL